MTNQTSNLKVVVIPASEIPSSFGRYQKEVIEYGHQPGVLSGADLKGRAREYGDRYARSRQRVEEFVARYGVVSALVPSLPGRPRVWVDAQTNEPVELFIK